MYAGALDEPTSAYSAKVSGRKGPAGPAEIQGAQTGNPSSSFLQVLHASRVGEAHVPVGAVAPEVHPGVGATASFLSSSRANAAHPGPTSA